MTADTWKLQDAKAQFSEVVRRARAGEPQEVTVHGKKAVAVVDLDRFEVRRKQEPPKTMQGFFEASEKYRLDIDFDFDRPLYMTFPRPDIFDENDKE
jgi:prevent-host-death family protein